MGDQAMEAARLLVVQPGTRANFRRRVMDAMRGLVPAPGAFFCFGTNDALAYSDSARTVDGAMKAIAGSSGVTLSRAFGFERQSVVETGRRVYVADELYPPDERRALPYFASHSADRFTRALLVFLHEGGVLFGLAGLERRSEDPEFSSEETSRLETLSPFVVAAGRAQLGYDELSREAAALRAFQKTPATLLVVDRDARRVVWAANRVRGVDWESEVLPHAQAIVDAAEQSLEARNRGDALPTLPTLPMGRVTAVTRLEGDPVFGRARCAVVRVESGETADLRLDGLSRREREIARLLVAGYSGINVAAIIGLSENTVRTYVRRLYAKLGVANRADLVRKLVAPEPKRPNSSMAALPPPPDSALAEGDDTLD